MWPDGSLVKVVCPNVHLSGYIRVSRFPNQIEAVSVGGRVPNDCSDETRVPAPYPMPECGSFSPNAGGFMPDPYLGSCSVALKAYGALLAISTVLPKLLAPSLRESVYSLISLSLPSARGSFAYPHSTMDATMLMPSGSLTAALFDYPGDAFKHEKMWAMDEVLPFLCLPFPAFHPSFL
mmetsp:Transcript_2939/g.9004  ORF Transcript_2939/g.9004 Transcript_2939/m.9004 type:complete len:179 (-) Transcript_2939:156-692(-)|eukprot:scaffold44662_cov28-Tisochrysis_lutea.AAC.1